MYIRMNGLIEEMETAKYKLLSLAPANASQIYTIRRS